MRVLFLFVVTLFIFNNNFSQGLSSHTLMAVCDDCTKSESECVKPINGNIKLNFTVSFTTDNLPPDLLFTLYSDNNLNQSLAGISINKSEGNWTNNPANSERIHCDYYQFHFELLIPASYICQNAELNEMSTFDFVLGIEYKESNSIFPITQFGNVFDSNCFGHKNTDDISYISFSTNVCCNNEVSPRNHINNKVHRKTNIYPNPSSGLVNFELINVNKILLYDNSGSLVNTFQVIDNKQQIDFSNYQNGIFFVKLILTDGKFSIEKILKF